MPGRPLGAKEREETRRGLAEGCASWNWLASKRPISTVSREISGPRPKSYSGVTASHRPAMRSVAINFESARLFSPARGTPDRSSPTDRDRARVSRWDRRAQSVSETI